MFVRALLVFLILLALLAKPLLAADRDFGGIGAQVVPIASGEVVVLHLVKNSPASQAGLLPGDLIIKIDGHPLKGLDFKSVTRDHLWGFVGDPVHVTWLRPGEAGAREAALVRVSIDPESLRSPGIRMLQPKK